MRLKNKVALITGGGLGIGRATALLFAREGAKIVCMDINTDNLNSVMNEIREVKGDIQCFTGDATLKADIEKSIDLALESYDRLDILVNNVGGGSVCDYGLEGLTDEAWEVVMGRNTRSLMYGCQLAAPVMKKQQSGSIINVSSATATYVSGEPLLAMAKAAVIAFTRTIAMELAPYNIRCNVIVPGTIFNKSGWKPLLDVNPDLDKELIQNIPMNRFGDAADIAPLMVYLASDESSWMTGTPLVLDGGYSLGSIDFSRVISDVVKKASKTKK